MNNCLNPNCKKLTKNPKYCSQSCAAVINNKVPKRKRKKYYCKECGIEVPYKRKVCDNHLVNKKVKWNKLTLKDVRLSTDYKTNHHARIRDHSKRAYKASTKPKKCVQCNYTKHYEVCHIKPIYMFDENTTIATINSLDNLIALCPNCHWEFDNGLINLSEL